MLFPPWTVTEEFVPKVNNATRGYKKGEVFLKEKEITFNPNSRRHIEHCLREKYGWKPTVFTPSGEAKVDESILSKLKYPEAQKLARIFMLQKRIGQLAEGKQAWLRLVDSDGKLRHSINPNGTVSGRCSSHHPNMQQVPSVRAEYGKCGVNFSGQPKATSWLVSTSHPWSCAVSPITWTMAIRKGGRQRRHTPVERRQNGCL